MRKIGGYRRDFDFVVAIDITNDDDWMLPSSSLGLFRIFVAISS